MATMDLSAPVKSCHVAKCEIPWPRKLQEGSLLCSLGFGGHSAVNTLLDELTWRMLCTTFLDEPAMRDELGKMWRHHAKPNLPSSFASMEFGEERRLPSFLSSEVCEDHKLPSSFLSDNTLPLSVPSDNKLLSTCFSADRTEGTKILYEDDTVETHGVSQLQLTTFSAGIARRESKCNSEVKSISDLISGDHDVSNKRTLEGTSTWDELPWDDHVTTVMIRQLPLRCTQAQLIDELTSRGFGNAFDFLFIPWDLKKRQNIGYGFVNFLKPMYAVACRDAFDGTYLPLQSPRNPLTVHPAHLQGYEANYKHFSSTKVGKKQPPPRFNPIFLPLDSASGPMKIVPRNLTDPKHSKTSKFKKSQ